MEAIHVKNADWLMVNLGEHIDRFQHAVYNAKLAKGKTMQERKAEVDAALSWFIYNLKDEMGAQLYPALDVLGLSVADFLELMKAQLRYDSATLDAVFGEARKAKFALETIGSSEQLFRDNLNGPLTQADVDLAWTWVQRYTKMAFTATTNTPNEAFYCAKQRAELMAARADWFARGDADLIMYALGQLEVDARIKL